MGHFGNPLTEYSPEMEALEFEQEYRTRGDGVFNETQEMEFAAELLEVNNEQELEQFLGDLIKSAGKAIGGIVKSPIGRALGGVLKSAAKVALPIAGGALGTFVGGPLGTTIGSSLGSMAGKALGLELEGLSQEDREFEAARQFVKFASETVKNAMQAPPDVNPFAVARTARVKLPVNMRRDYSMTTSDSLDITIITIKGTGSGTATRSFCTDSEANSERTTAMHEYDIPAFHHEAESYEYSYPKVFSESQELELAAELMEVNSEQELEQFLGDLIKKAGSAIGGHHQIADWPGPRRRIERCRQTGAAHGRAGTRWIHWRSRRSTDRRPTRFRSRRHVWARAGSGRAGVRSRAFLCAPGRRRS